MSRFGEGDDGRTNYQPPELSHDDVEWLRVCTRYWDEAGDPKEACALESLADRIEAYLARTTPTNSAVENADTLAGRAAPDGGR